jgi:hypothetical protein
MWTRLRMMLGYYRPGDKVVNRYNTKSVYTLVANTGEKHYGRRDSGVDCLG